MPPIASWSRRVEALPEKPGIVTLTGFGFSIRSDEKNRCHTSRPGAVSASPRTITVTTMAKGCHLFGLFPLAIATPNSGAILPPTSRQPDRQTLRAGGMIAEPTGATLQGCHLFGLFPLAIATPNSGAILPPTSRQPDRQTLRAGGMIAEPTGATLQG